MRRLIGIAIDIINGCAIERSLSNLSTNLDTPLLPLGEVPGGRGGEIPTLFPEMNASVLPTRSSRLSTDMQARSTLLKGNHIYHEPAEMSS